MISTSLIFKKDSDYKWTCTRIIWANYKLFRFYLWETFINQELYHGNSVSKWGRWNKTMIKGHFTLISNSSCSDILLPILKDNRGENFEKISRYKLILITILGEKIFFTHFGILRKNLFFVLFFWILKIFFMVYSTLLKFKKILSFILKLWKTVYGNFGWQSKILEQNGN